MFNLNGKLVSPEIEVPLIIKGLSTVYGNKVVHVLKKSFPIKGLHDFIKNDLLFDALVNFYQQELKNAVKLRMMRKKLPLSLYQPKGEK